MEPEEKWERSSIAFIPLFSKVSIPYYRIEGIIIEASINPHGLSYKIEYSDLNGIKDRWFYAQQVVRV